MENGAKLKNIKKVKSACKGYCFMIKLFPLQEQWPIAKW